MCEKKKRGGREVAIDRNDVLQLLPDLRETKLLDHKFRIIWFSLWVSILLMKGRQHLSVPGWIKMPISRSNPP